MHRRVLPEPKHKKNAVVSHASKTVFSVPVPLSAKPAGLASTWLQDSAKVA